MSIASCIRHSLATSCSTSSSKIFPCVLAKTNRSVRSSLAADTALDFYKGNGFDGERSYVGTQGYATILNKLLSEPPWIAPDFGDVSGPRLIDEILDKSDEELLALHHAYYREMFDVVQENELHLVMDIMQAQFRSIVQLGRLLGTKLNDLHDALFYSFDGLPEITLMPGAPDLLLWFPDAANGFWLFTEVKAPGDYLSSTQRGWLEHNWELLEGHFLITLLDPGSA